MARGRPRKYPLQPVQEVAQVVELRGSSTIKMVIEIPLVIGGPIVADVHPDEVENMLKSGWRIYE